MTRNPQDRISDALTAIERCRLFNDQLKAEPALTLMAEDAIERNLQVLGEAVSHLPVEMTSRYPEVPWTQIRGFRNILVHQYFSIDISVIRDVVENHLPQLEAALHCLADGK
ncbi:DUF86 domain-containing protein [Corynebacterium sp. TA-R-1]|uniref:DUF86 domain-containing protein n=1 Tax=Corynebacterium stercoris TaxID=2943490 RepID=A0ABT1G1X0_9CORY|nr:HepT-like ribonuclease domain-containing protein [Corynebacterium stercoris]MCP1388021.1 DUF86 domain-containing protein [Corynebacterium stercoris]